MYLFPNPGPHLAVRNGGLGSPQGMIPRIRSQFESIFYGPAQKLAMVNMQPGWWVTLMDLKGNLTPLLNKNEVQFSTEDAN